MSRGHWACRAELTPGRLCPPQEPQPLPLRASGPPWALPPPGLGGRVGLPHVSRPQGAPRPSWVWPPCPPAPSQTCHGGFLQKTSPELSLALTKSAAHGRGAVCLSSPHPQPPPVPFIPGKNPSKTTNIDSAPVTKTTLPTGGENKAGGVPPHSPLPAPCPPMGPSRTGPGCSQGTVGQPCVGPHLRGAAFTRGLILCSQWGGH